MAAEEELQLTLNLRNQFSDELKRMITQIGQLEAALRDATNGTSGATEQDISRLSSELSQAQNNAKTMGMAIDKLDQHVDELGDEASQTSGQLNRLSAAAGKTKKGFSGVIAAGRGAALGITAVAAATVAGAVGFGKLNTMVGQFQQNMLKSRAVFGKQTREMKKWARAHRDDFGSSTQEVLSYAASLQDLFVPMGFGRKQATGMTKDMAGLVPVLTAWDRQGRSSAEITDILAAAVTGERESLKSLGIVISQDAVNAQVKLMRSHGKLKGATDEQAQAQATLALLYKKSGDAQDAYKRNSDTIARRTKRVTAEVKQLRDNGLKTLIGVWDRTTAVFNKRGFGSPLKELGKWINRNREDIIGFFMKVGWGIASWISLFTKGVSVMIKGFGYIVGGIAQVLHFMALLDPRFQGAADGADRVAKTLGDTSSAFDSASKGAKKTADQFWAQSEAAHKAQQNNDLLRESLDKLKNKKVKVVIRTIVKGGFGSLGIGAPVPDTTGDTASPWGTGPALGPAGLAAAHAGYAANLGGHRITSGVRGWNLGSAHSDHLRGRAMDITGPRLGSYAQAVRAAGGYAAFHGTGGSRHLHVVPRTHRPEPVMAAGGDTFHNELHFHGPAKPFDVRSAVISANRDTARRRRERGGR